ncbi:MAG: DUF1801 domain-containing protein [Pseudomonadota bacterium]
MAKSENKTKVTGQSVDAFLSGIEHDSRARDGRILLTLFENLTGWPAQMWGGSIIGFGRYRYRYETGRSGEYLVTGFSPRKSALTIYIMPGYRDLSEPLFRLGKHKLGKSCLYINTLSDVDLAVLEEIVRNGVDYMTENYEVTAT